MVYDSKYRGLPVNKSTVHKYTGVTFEEWVEVSGMFVPGFPPIFASKDDFILSGTYPKIIIKAERKGIASIKIEFNLEENKIIDHFIFIERSYRGHGWIAFQEHIKKATRLGFDRLECYAFGGSDDENKDNPDWAFNGYITWAKFGFTMTPEYQKIYEEMLIQDRREVVPLHELLKENDGLQYWKDKGFAWDGVFSLRANSLNRDIFDRY